MTASWGVRISNGRAEIREGMRVMLPLGFWLVACQFVEVPDDLTVGAAVRAGVWRLLLVLAAILVVRRAPGIRSWADLGLSRARPVSWRRGTVLIAAGSMAGIAVSHFSQEATQAVVRIFDPLMVTFGGNPAWKVPDPSQIPSDFARLVVTSVVEEILLFAFPIALAAVFIRRWPHKVWVRRAAIIGGAAFVVGVRMAGHAYWGSLVIGVVPWMAGIWLIFRICGTVWPLIVGHALFNVLVTFSYRYTSSAASTVFTITAYFGVAALAALIAHHLRDRAHVARPG